MKWAIKKKEVAPSTTYAKFKKFSKSKILGNFFLFNVLHTLSAINVARPSDLKTTLPTDEGPPN